MKKMIIIFISLFLTAFPVYADKLGTDKLNQSGDNFAEKGLTDGEFEAKDSYSADRWVEGGLLSGFLLGLIGTGIIAGASQFGTIEPPQEDLLKLQDKPYLYKIYYIIGYSNQVKRKRLTSSIKGGLIGTAAIVLIYLNYRPLREKLD